MVRFGDLEDLFQKCKAHLAATHSEGTEIENYFVQLLLVRICAEFELRLQALIEKRGLRSNDEKTQAFVQSCIRQVCKDFDVGAMGGILKRFSLEYRENFTRNIINQEPSVAWDNIYKNRNTVAHRIGVIQMTLPELETTYRKSLVVFDELITALELRPRELKGLR